jgi:hypothetical protein
LFYCREGVFRLTGLRQHRLKGFAGAISDHPRVRQKVFRWISLRLNLKFASMDRLAAGIDPEKAANHARSNG